MSRIFKYPLAVEKREMIYMPKHSRILSVAVQQDIPVLFATVDERYPPVARIIRVVTTGENFNDEGCWFIGTLLMGEPTWFTAHVFEQIEFGQPDVRATRYDDDFRDIRRELASHDHS